MTDRVLKAYLNALQLHVTLRMTFVYSYNATYCIFHSYSNSYYAYDEYV